MQNMLSIDELTQYLHTYLTPSQVEQVRRAYEFAARAHAGQTRCSGEPYVTHPLVVARILADMHMDHQSLVAAILHDVIEDTGVSKSALSKLFGKAVADIVDGVSKLTHAEHKDKALAQADNFQKMALAMARDVRVILVKLADRLHNMRTLGALAPEKRQRIARETLDIYSPLANRLGMRQLGTELEDLCFAAIYPMRSSLLLEAVRRARRSREEIVKNVVERIRGRLKSEGLEGSVAGREKHLYGIYSKMRDQKKSFSDIMNVFGVRILVDDIDSCYRAVGFVHNLFKPIPGRFKDYVAIPKANGYQSLHTTLFGNHGVPVEVQIRTREMEDLANRGIAAHWLKKSSGGDVLAGGRSRTRHWLQSLLELQQNADNSLEFIESVKADLFPDEVYVFTPRGDITVLPGGATPVDFAYSVHTDIGNACVACRVDRKLASLSQPLSSGETVEILTAPGARPNAAWLNYVATSKARSNILHYLKTRRQTEAIALGRRLLEKALAGFSSRLSAIPQEQQDAVLTRMGYTRMEELLESVGSGSHIAYVVARRLLDASDTEPEAKEIAGGKALSIKGTEGIVISFAHCCYPIPGDPVLGQVSAGKGLVIHHQSCDQLAQMRPPPEKILDVEWDKDVQGDFLVELQVHTNRKQGVVASLASVINTAGANIEKIGVEERDLHSSRARVLISVSDRVHLAGVIKQLRRARDVCSIMRFKPGGSPVQASV